MPLLGAHMSIAGGYYKAVEIAQQCGCDCVQLFTKNNNQWHGKPISADEARRFREALVERKIQAPLSHNSYLINLAAPDDTLWDKSVAAMIDELRRAETLGIPYVVAHPGSYTSSSEAAGLARIVAGLDRVHQETGDVQAQVLLETTAGQGTNLGWRFEQLATILAGVRHADRLGVCLDTCHLFAAGYPLADAADYAETMRQLDRVIGLGRVRAVHLNDSVKGLGSRVDRHAHIGQGQIGIDAFAHLLNDPRFAAVPMYLETPKEDPVDEPWDVVNLRTLRGLLKG